MTREEVKSRAALLGRGTEDRRALYQRLKDAGERRTVSGRTHPATVGRE
jgi:hypothetical protein